MPLYFDSHNTTKANHFAPQMGGSDALALTEVSRNHQGLLVVVVSDTPEAQRLKHEISFFAADEFEILNLPDWETLPYDLFSPHQDIISSRLLTLYQLPSTKKGILIVPINTLIQRLAPSKYLQLHSLV